MQITDEMVEAAADSDARFYGHESLSVLGRVHRDRYLARSRAALEAALGAKRGDAPKIVQELLDGGGGKPCDCFRCRSAACIEDLAAALKEFDNIGMGHSMEIYDKALKARATLERWGLK